MADIIDLDAAEEAPKPRILVISLEYLESFDDLINIFLTPMLDLALVQRVKKAATLTRLLTKEDAEPYSALVLTDAALTLPENLPLWEQCLAYMRRTDATAVLTGQVASFGLPDDLDELFGVSGLPDWKCGNYQRDVVVLNPKADGIRDGKHLDLSDKKSLKAAYSAKSLCLSGVKIEHRWYVPDLSEVGDGMGIAALLAQGLSGWDPEKVGRQAAVAYGPVGEKGRIGWVGDVNNEPPSVKVILAMCGLDPAKANIINVEVRQPSGPAAMRWDAGEGRFVKV